MHRIFGKPKDDAGSQFYAEKKFDLALEYYQKQYALTKENRYLVAMGQCQTELGRHQDAIKSYDAVPEGDYSYCAALANKAITFSRMGKKEEVLVLQERALKIKPHHPVLLYNKAITLYKLSRFKEALNTLNTAIAYYPAKDSKAQSLKGEILDSLQKKYEKAIVRLKQVSESKNELVDWNQLIQEYQKQNQEEKGEHDLYNSTLMMLLVEKRLFKESVVLMLMGVCPDESLSSILATHKDSLFENVKALSEPLRRKALNQSIDENTILGSIFFKQRGDDPCHLSAGTLKLICTEIEKSYGYGVESGRLSAEKGAQINGDFGMQNKQLDDLLDHDDFQVWVPETPGKK